VSSAENQRVWLVREDERTSAPMRRSAIRSRRVQGLVMTLGWD
jgi:hypothetical protein